MIKVYNKQTSFIVIGNKHIAPFKEEIFDSRNAIIRSLERSGIVRVTEITPSNINPVTPELFDYQVEKNESIKQSQEIQEQEQQQEEKVENEEIKEEKKEEIEEIIEAKEVEVEIDNNEENNETNVKEEKENVEEVKTTTKRKRNTKKKGE